MIHQASRDSTVNVWSTDSGGQLTSINLMYTLTDFKTTNDGNRLIFRFEDSAYFPIIGLSIKNINKTHTSNFFNRSFTSLKSVDISNRRSIHLPIKPKPLFFKKSKYFTKLFQSIDSRNSSCEQKEKKRNALESSNSYVMI